MFNVNNLYARAVLAIALATGAGAALAVPTTYHVAIDSRSSTGAALLNLTFNGAINAAPATATVSNFTGVYGAVYETAGAVSGSIADMVSISNTAFDNYLSQFVTLGGLFGFDVMFDVASSDPGMQFSVAMYLPDYAGYALGADNLVTIDLVPDANTLLAGSAFASVSAVGAVPEPGNMLLMLTGLMLIAFAARRRAR